MGLLQRGAALCCLKRSRLTPVMPRCSCCDPSFATCEAKLDKCDDDADEEENHGVGHLVRVIAAFKAAEDGCFFGSAEVDVVDQIFLLEVMLHLTEPVRHAPGSGGCGVRR